MSLARLLALAALAVVPDVQHPGAPRGEHAPGVRGDGVVQALRAEGARRAVRPEHEPPAEPVVGPAHAGDDGDRFVATPSFHVYAMYRPHHDAKSVRLDVQAPEVSFQAGGHAARIFRVAGSASRSGPRDLALTLVVPRDDGPAASLASYQLEVLRDKNRELSKRLRELYAISQENERLAVRTHQLTLALMRQPDAASTVRALAATLAEDFNGDLVRLVLFAPVAGLAGSPGTARRSGIAWKARYR